MVGIEGDRVRYIAGNDNGRVQEDTLPLTKVAGFRRPPEAGTAGPLSAGAGGGAADRAVTDAFRQALSSTAAPSGAYRSAQLSGDPRAARILDFVAGPESGGNYNAIFGNARSAEDLSRRTLDQTIAWSRSRGTASSATGRYQFMADTLEGLKSELGISGSVRFTPELQDRMALALLNRRGFREWTQGRLSGDQFAANLAKEWAGLPDPRTGRSAYAGDGVNRAGVSSAQVQAALGGAGGSAPAAGSMPTPRPRTAAPAIPAPAPASPVPASDAYANVPDASLAARLREANPDPVANTPRALKTIPADLAEAIRKAQADNPKLKFVVAARGGEGGAEVWPLDAEGRVTLDPAQQDAVGAAIRRSAVQLGHGVSIGAGQGGARTLVTLAGPVRQA